MASRSVTPSESNRQSRYDWIEPLTILALGVLMYTLARAELFSMRLLLSLAASVAGMVVALGLYLTLLPLLTRIVPRRPSPDEYASSQSSSSAQY